VKFNTATSADRADQVTLLPCLQVVSIQTVAPQIGHPLGHIPVAPYCAMGDVVTSPCGRIAYTQRGHLAGVLEYERAVFPLDVLVPPQAGRCSQEQRGKRTFARLQGVEPKVITVELDEIERPHENARVILPETDAVE